MLSRREVMVRTARTGGTLLAAGGAVAGYGFWEAAHVRIVRETVVVPNLPPGFEGATVGVLADLHHGPYVSLDFVRHATELANSLRPDFFALVGDYGHRGTHAEEEVPPCLDVLAGLSAPLGCFAVPGNHDLKGGGGVYRKAIAATPLTDLTNRHVVLERNGDRLVLAGVDDLWWGKPNVSAALAGIPTGAATILLSHNPDYAETSPDGRVGLVLSGHTHGGQVYLGEPATRWVPSRFGMKYRRGLVQGPASKVYVSRGLGEAGVPLRVNSPPEINLLTLVGA